MAVSGRLLPSFAPNRVDAGYNGPYRDGYWLARWLELRRWIEPLVALSRTRAFLRKQPIIPSALPVSAPLASFHSGEK